MKLLFDQNLSFKLCKQLAGEFPDSSQVRLLGLAEADDAIIWQHAKTNGFTLVTQDADFADMSALFGAPPKIILLRCGNQPTQFVAKLLHDQADVLQKFEQDNAASCWEIY